MTFSSAAAKFLFLLLGLCLIVAVTLVLARLYAQRGTAARIRISSANGIHSIEKIKLGGIDQWIQIRSEDRSKPILLFLHGGPGFPQMPFSHLNAELEKEFVVVQWDQRGAGKSYSSSIPDASMTIEQIVSDTHELTLYLRERFGRNKIYLVAHSWGTIVGARSVAQYPELFRAYVGISQAVDPPKSERMMYRYALAAGVKGGNKKAVAELDKIGVPPYKSTRDYHTLQRWVSHFNTADYSPISPWRFIRLGFASPAVSWLDPFRIWVGFRYSFAHLWREAFYQTNLFKQAPRIDVPVYFFLGRHDRTVTVSAAMAAEYFRALDAPRGKTLIWFENSGHWPQLEEPRKYRDTLVNQVLQETSP